MKYRWANYRPSGEVLQISIEKGYTFFTYKSFGSDRKRIEISLLFQYFFQKSPSVWMEDLKTQYFFYLYVLQFWLKKDYKLHPFSILFSEKSFGLDGNFQYFFYLYVLQFWWKKDWNFYTFFRKLLQFGWKDEKRNTFSIYMSFSSDRKRI